MSPTFHPTDGPHDTLLIRLGRRDIGLINRPPAQQGRYCAYTLAGEVLSDGHPSPHSAAPACCAYAAPCCWPATTAFVTSTARALVGLYLSRYKNTRQSSVRAHDRV